jgi:hypothetical protein
MNSGFKGYGKKIPGLVLLEKYNNISNLASINFKKITSEYDEYMLKIVNLIPVTTNTNLQLQFSLDGGSSWDASNQWYAEAQYCQNGGGTGVWGDNPNTSFSIAKNISNTTAGYALDATLYFSGVANPSLYEKIYGQVTYLNNSGFIWGAHFFAHFNVIASYNAFKLFMSSGNILSGSARLYGYAKS